MEYVDHHIQDVPSNLTCVFECKLDIAAFIKVENNNLDSFSNF